MLILSSPSNPLTDVTAIGDSIRVLHVETPGPVDKQLLENNTESLYTVTYSVGRRRCSKQNYEVGLPVLYDLLDHCSLYQ